LISWKECRMLMVMAESVIIVGRVIVVESVTVVVTLMTVENILSR
jgi:hypothetical protein